MNRRLLLVALGGALLAAGVWALPTGAGGAPLRVLAAASLADVLPRVADTYRAAGGAAIVFSFDATSRLASQLKAGAPADLFFSADTRWMDDLAAQGLVRKASRVDLLGNRLVLVVPAAGGAAPAGAADLPALSGRLALAGEEVPAGRYAREALRHAGVWEALAPRVVGGDSVRTVLAWVARGEASAGVVYTTDARIEPRVRAAFTFPEAGHTPIVYPVAVTSSSTQEAEAARFLTYCAGPGRAPFEAAGFTVLAPTSP